MDGFFFSMLVGLLFAVSVAGCGIVMMRLSEDLFWRWSRRVMIAHTLIVALFVTWAVGNRLIFAVEQIIKRFM